jgi:hypothetical protein
VLVDGAVRDRAELAAADVGLLARALCPMPSDRKAPGQVDVPLQIEGLWVRPGEWLYADEDGVVVSPRLSRLSEIEAIVRRCRRMVTQRALLAAGVATVPVPGLDWVTDVGILVRLLPKINEAFGLSPGTGRAPVARAPAGGLQGDQHRRRDGARQGHHARPGAQAAEGRSACA